MPSNKSRSGKRPLRGETLDQALTRELESMIAEGVDVSPISVAAVARRLALGSRTTLYEPARLERLHAARMRQKQSSRAAKSAAPSSGDGTIPSSQIELQQLRKQLNELRGYVVQIAVNAHRMGLQPDLLLSLSKQAMKDAELMTPERIVMQYLSSIGLLAKLDTNVRGLAR